MRVTRLLAATAAGLTAMLCVPSVASANQTIQATAGGSASCPGRQIVVGGKFVLTSALTAGTPITINTEVSALTRYPTGTSGSGSNITNSYDGSFDGLLDRGNIATVSVSDTWAGRFELVSVSCRNPVAATVNAQASLPGVEPSIHVEVANSNPIMTTYQVSAPGLESKTVKVLGGRKEAVDLTTPGCGTSYTVLAKDNFGTQATATATMPACTPGEQPPPPAPTPSPSKSVVKPSASPSASVSAESPTPNSSYEAFADPTYAEGGVLDVPTSATRPKLLSSNPLTNWVTWLGIGIVLAAGLVSWLLLRRRNHHD